MSQSWILIAAWAIIVVALAVGYVTTRKRLAARRAMRLERKRRPAAIDRH